MVRSLSLQESPAFFLIFALTTSQINPSLSSLGEFFWNGQLFLPFGSHLYWKCLSAWESYQKLVIWNHKWPVKLSNLQGYMVLMVPIGGSTRKFFNTMELIVFFVAHFFSLVRMMNEKIVLYLHTSCSLMLTTRSAMSQPSWCDELLYLSFCQIFSLFFLQRC